MVYHLSMEIRKKKEHDFAVNAFRIVRQATGQPKFDAVSLGRRGGLKGGRARAEKLTPEQRSAIAKKAAQVRWGK